MTPEKALYEAIGILGGKRRLALAIGVTPQAVTQWKICPPRHALAVESAIKTASHRAIKGPDRHDLCPEYYPRERLKKPTKGD